jgi:catechol 2,3-dioxygenase-like lactoylglutathione lyase family enzyme
MIPVEDLSEVVRQSEALGLPKVEHLGYVVTDIQHSMRRYRELFGMEWKDRYFEHSAENGAGEEITAAGYAAIGFLGEFRFELVQPTVSGWPAANHLDRHGEGMFHCGFRVANVYPFRDAAKAAGMEIEMFSANESVTVAFINPGVPSGTLIEVLSPLRSQSKV